MNFKKLILLLFPLLIFTFCGKPETSSLKIEGKVTPAQIVIDEKIPLLVAITRDTGSENMDNMEDTLADSLIKVVSVDETDYSYSIDLSDTDISAGEKINVFAFADKNYNQGMPTPDPGDYVGFYVDSDSMSASIEMKEGGNTGIDLNVKRKVYDFESTLSGTVSSPDTGDLTIIAYAGEITSSDFSKLDFDGVIGFKKVSKTATSVSYSMKILPYGYNVPIKKVYIFAMLDKNRDGKINNGDIVTYYTVDNNSMPSSIIINEGETPGVNMNFASHSINVTESSGYNISLRGTFTIPNGYSSDPTTGPIYIIVSDMNNMDSITDDPASALKFFYKLPQGEFYFDIDLSSTDLKPGDKVAVIALWDRDYDGGFPNPTRGDKLGFLQNKDSYSFTVELLDGENAIPKEGYELTTNKKVYEYTASLQFALDMENAGSCNTDIAQIIVMCVHVDGVEMSYTNGKMDVKIDMDYLLGIKILPPTEYDYIGGGNREDPAVPRNLDILTIIYEGLTVYEANDPPEPLIRGNNYGSDDEETAYLFAIFDKNGNNTLDSDDEIGYYAREETVTNETITIPGSGEITVPDGTYYLPAPIKRITKGVNKEDRGDDPDGPYWILMNKFQAN